MKFRLTTSLSHTFFHLISLSFLVSRNLLLFSGVKFSIIVAENHRIKGALQHFPLKQKAFTALDRNDQVNVLNSQ